jgi:CDP-paratose 2-epimerase
MSISKNGHNGRPRARGARNGDGRVSQRPVLITGGAGFIGTNLAASFLAEGRPVTVFDNLSRAGVEQNLSWLIRTYSPLVRVEQADIRNSSSVHKAVEQASCVFHLAAQVAVTTSLLDPHYDFEVNAGGTLNVLEACRQMPSPPPLLFTSTNKVYGSLSDVPLVRRGNRYLPQDEKIRQHGIDERQPLDFHSPYGCSKGTADQYVLDYARCMGLPAVVFRMSCIYGPHQHGTEDQGWAAHFVRQIINRRPITIYGDGAQVRDMLFVEDLVRAMRLAVQRVDVTRGQAFNMGGGPANAVSVSEVVDMLAELDGTTPAVQRSDWRSGDQRYYVSDTKRFEQLTGWMPQVGVKRGLSLLNEWLGEREGTRESVSVAEKAHPSFNGNVQSRAREGSALAAMP